MQKQISLREYLILITVAIMSPIVKLVPGKLAKQAGTGAWLSALTMLPVVLAVIWLIWHIGRKLPEGTGLADFFCLSMGTGLGRVLCTLYGVWFVLLGSLSLRLGAERFMSTIYPDTGMGLFFIVILILEWELGRQRLCVTARVVQIFFFAVTASLFIVLAFGIGTIKPYNVYPFWIEDVPRIMLGGIPVLSGAGFGVGALMLFDTVGECEQGFKRVQGWIVTLFGVMTILGFVVMGAFGEAMVTRLEIPFFSLAKEVSIDYAVQRIEPIVVAMWVFADVTIVALELRCAERALCCAVGLQEGEVVSALLFILLPMGYLVSGSEFALEQVYTGIVTYSEQVFFYGIPLLAVVVGKIRGVLL